MPNDRKDWSKKDTDQILQKTYEPMPPLLPAQLKCQTCPFKEDKNICDILSSSYNGCEKYQQKQTGEQK